MSMPILYPRTRAAFTIIEVMIVLVVAAVILLIVFLAVPALQRNSRNTQRKSDITRIRAAWESYLVNNGNVVPSGSQTGIAAQIYSEANPQTLNDANITDSTSLVSESETTIARAIFRTRSVCNATNTNITTATSTGRVAMLYFLETAGGWQLRCEQVR